MRDYDLLRRLWLVVIDQIEADNLSDNGPRQEQAQNENPRFFRMSAIANGNRRITITSLKKSKRLISPRIFAIYFRGRATEI